MYRAIPKRLWEKPLDLNFQATSEGELQVPFSRFVLPTKPTESSSVSFPQFLQLPAELQLQVFSFCDNPTLFQLMHTSSCIRSEAKKLFFSSPDTWYCVDADWISRGCYPGDARYDMQFLPVVEQLEVQFPRMNEDYWLWRYHKTGDTFQEFEYEPEEEDRVAERLEQCFYDFWQRLHAHFPRVVRVMIQCNNYLRPPCDLPPEIFKRVGRMCSQGTEVSFSLLKTPGPHRTHQAERGTWHQSPDTKIPGVAAEWEEDLTQLQPRVMLPNKVFRGPLGAYEYSIHKRLERYHFEYTIMVMLIAAVEKHHFDGWHSPFRCPAPHCSALFDQAGEFTTHVINYYEHQRHIVPPEHYKTFFAEANARLEVLRQDENMAMKAFRDQWDRDGTERRNATENTAVHQVANDPLYASEKPGYDSYIMTKAIEALDGIV